MKEILLLTLILGYHKIINVQAKPALSEIEVFDEINSNFVNVFTETTTESFTTRTEFDNSTRIIQGEDGNLTKNVAVCEDCEDDWVKYFKDLWNSMVSKFKNF